MNVVVKLDLSRYDIKQLTTLVSDGVISMLEVVESGRLDELLTKWSAKYQWMSSVGDVVEYNEQPTGPCCNWGCDLCESTRVIGA